MAGGVCMARTCPGLLLAINSGATPSAGSISLALAPRGRPPQPLVIAYAVQTPLLTLAALFSLTAELIGAVLLLICGTWIVWRTSQSPARTVEVPVSSGSV